MRRYCIRPGVVFEMVDSEAVLLNLESSTYYKLNPLGARIWQLLLNEPTAEQVAEQVQREYQVGDDELRRDLSALLAELEEARLVHPIVEEQGRAVD